MSDSLRERFAAFIRNDWGELISDLEKALGTPLQILDSDGSVILSSDSMPAGSCNPSGTNPAQTWVPIEVDGETLGSLVAFSDDLQMQPLLFSFASRIGESFTTTRDLDEMTDQLSQSYDEVNLLYRLSHALSPDQELPTTAQKLLGETADLLGQRLLIFCQPEQRRLQWSVGAGAALPEGMDWLVDNADAIYGIHTQIIQESRGRGRTDVIRCPGSLPSPQGPIHYTASPFWVQSSTAGFVGAFWMEQDGAFETGELHLLECLARELSNAATTRHLYKEVSDMLFSTVRSLVAAIDAKDEYTRGHSERVYRISILIGQRLGLSREQLQTLTWAAILHDIGKIAISEQILKKPSKLTDKEFAVIRTHPERGCKVLEPIPQLRDALPAIRHHHERYNGTGYPDGLKGEDIPLLARIIAVADTYDAISSSRAYREAQPLDFALKEIRDCAGTQFDPDAAAAFLELIENGVLKDADVVGIERRAA
ncbi:MAG: HD-GYP domain-containing protein [Candidatus Eisenbacteria sp.]|nr:HD-GYP domain-containing protein [Candidatus Eisenbacteria bacterium]